MQVARIIVVGRYLHIHGTLMIINFCNINKHKKFRFLSMPPWQHTAGSLNMCTQTRMRRVCVCVCVCVCVYRPRRQSTRSVGGSLSSSRRLAASTRESVLVCHNRIRCLCSWTQTKAFKNSSWGGFFKGMQLAFELEREDLSRGPCKCDCACGILHTTRKAHLFASTAHTVTGIELVCNSYHEHIVIQEGHVSLRNLVHDVLSLALQHKMPPVAHQAFRPASTHHSKKSISVAAFFMITAP
jgi:hypothetical protein